MCLLSTCLGKCASGESYSVVNTSNSPLLKSLIYQDTNITDGFKEKLLMNGRKERTKLQILLKTDMEIMALETTPTNTKNVFLEFSNKDNGDLSGKVSFDF